MMATKNGSNGHGKRKPCAPCSAEAGDLAHQLELCSAVRDAAIESLDKATKSLASLEGVIRRQGGYLPFKDQQALATATALLELHGLRVGRQFQPWSNRK